ncbi:MAG: cytochrome c biogenesis protein CcsA [Gammaproteobacteria bacterium]|nr:cytochrome c biogenesis protein CcsA [Gammaproteobacteria bacterium]
MNWFYRMASPPHFYRWSGTAIPWFLVPATVLAVIGLYLALVTSPTDYQMGDTVRIMYVHVPVAWLSLMCYTSMAVASAIGLIWRIKLAHAVAAAIAPAGASLTALALFTGSLWGKPTWGTYWVWDARLTSYLMLLFLFAGFALLRNAFSDVQRGDRAAAILAIVGVVNIPIIHYSVNWWNTLHQPASFSVTKGQAGIDSSMLWPLFTMLFAVTLYLVALVLMRTRNEVLIRERRKAWIKEVLVK